MKRMYWYKNWFQSISWSYFFVQRKETTFNEILCFDLTSTFIPRKSFFNIAPCLFWIRQNEYKRKKKKQNTKLNKWEKFQTEVNTYIF